MNKISSEEVVKAHRKREFKRLIIILSFIVVGLVSMVFDIGTGPAMLSPKEVIDTLLQPILGGEQDKFLYHIVYDIRLPVALMALVVGAALGAGGAEIQTLLNNPMASPYTLGLAAAAGFGASLVMAFGSFALLFLFQSMLSLVQFLSAPEISQAILFWLFGSLQKAKWSTLAVATVVTVVCISLLMLNTWALTALKLGEERAKSMGVNLSALRIKILLIVSVMTATVISFVGVIGFIGLVAPHIARNLVGEDQRFFLPTTIFVGAAFLSIASVLSKVINPGGLFPVGIITAFVGVPFFFWIILSRKNVC